MRTISLKLPEGLEKQLAAFAKMEKTSKSEVIRRALEEYLVNGGRASKRSFLTRAQDLAGCVAGPSDLSVNKEYLETYGK